MTAFHWLASIALVLITMGTWSIAGSLRALLEHHERFVPPPVEFEDDGE